MEDTGPRLPLRRRLIAGLIAAGVAVVAIPSALWTERHAIARRIASGRARGGTQGTDTLAEPDVDLLCQLAATLGGLAPTDPGSIAYARPVVRRAAERIPGAAFAMRQTLRAIDARSGPLAAAVGQLLTPPSRWRRYSPSARSAYVDMNVTLDVLQRIVLTSPQSWARVGYTQFPGAPGPMTDYLAPPRLS